MPRVSETHDLQRDRESSALHHGPRDVPSRRLHRIKGIASVLLVPHPLLTHVDEVTSQETFSSISPRTVESRYTGGSSSDSSPRVNQPGNLDSWPAFGLRQGRCTHWKFEVVGWNFGRTRKGRKSWRKGEKIGVVCVFSSKIIQGGVGIN